jgi:hypothetical protein
LGRKPEGLDATGGAVNNIMPEPGRHGWADLLRLVGSVRQLAFDRTLPPSEALGRIRDAFGDYDEGGA